MFTLFVDWDSDMASLLLLLHLLPPQAGKKRVSKISACEAVDRLVLYHKVISICSWHIGYAFLQGPICVYVITGIKKSVVEESGATFVPLFWINLLWNVPLFFPIWWPIEHLLDLGNLSLWTLLLILVKKVLDYAIISSLLNVLKACGSSARTSIWIQVELLSLCMRLNKDDVTAYSSNLDKYATVSQWLSDF